jgi:hypothetical protein
MTMDRFTRLNLRLGRALDGSLSRARTHFSVGGQRVERGEKRRCAAGSLSGRLARVSMGQLP